MIKEFFKYGLPSAFAMFASSLYTVVDGVFVGRGVGDPALAGVNLVLPITLMIFGIATLFAIGGGTIVSKYLGARQPQRAINAFRQTIKSLLIVSILISCLCLFFRESIISLFGTSQVIQQLASLYLGYYAVFCIPNMVGIALGSFVRNDGNPRLAMVATVLGSLSNILLDYLFIFVFSFGIKGAAIATGLGQIITVLTLLVHFSTGKGQLTYAHVKLNPRELKEIIMAGTPSLFAELAFALIIFFQNLALVKYIGDAGLTAFSIINYVTTTIYLGLLGLGFGIQPLVSYNYGAKKSFLMLEVYKLAVITSIIFNILYSTFCLFFGKAIVSIFTLNPTIIDMSYIGLNLTNLAFFILGFNLMLTIYYQAIQLPILSNFICISRSLIFLPLFVMPLGKYFGLNGIWLSLLFSEVATFFILTLNTNIETQTQKMIKKSSYKESYKSSL